MDASSALVAVGLVFLVLFGGYGIYLKWQVDRDTVLIDDLERRRLEAERAQLTPAE